ncbi:MAG: ABC transporter permease [Sciscionella sp.]|nr:ABC transporter permease [Sciscionella sp.]
MGNVRAVLLQVEGHWTWYRQHWYSTLFSNVLQPVLFLVALGIGFGSQVRSGAAIGGVSYLRWIAPALVVSSAMQNAAGESSYPVLSGFKWQKHLIARVVTPITPAQMLAGQLTWVGLRIFSSATAFTIIAVFFGAFVNAGVLLVLFVALLLGLACSAPIMALAATVYSEGNAFNALFRFVVMPMTLFAGTFFPISTLPSVIKPLVWISPLWHGTELARAAEFGGISALAVVGHLAYLLVLFAVGALLARWRFIKRLVV